MGKKKKSEYEPYDLDVLHPPLSVLVKLGSIVVHVEEMLSPDGHDYDRQTILASLNDPELNHWIERMTKMAFLPVKRNI